MGTVKGKRRDFEALEKHRFEAIRCWRSALRASASEKREIALAASVTDFKQTWGEAVRRPTNRGLPGGFVGGALATSVKMLSGRQRERAG